MVAVVRNIRTSNERGVVLFIALIVLVVMSLAGVAMNRSVENSLGIAGNLAFRKSTLQGTEKAIASAIAWVDNNRGLLNRPGEVDAATTGYYFSPSKALGFDDAWTSNYWNNSFGAGKDIVGNKLSYKIERLCEASNKGYADTTCALGNPPTSVSSSNNGNSVGGGSNSQFLPPPPLVLRITARSVGPRNSTSIVQVYYQVPM